MTLASIPVDMTDIAPGYRISRVLKGGWHLAGGHGAVDRDRAIAEMRDYVESGIVTFDCADIYTGVEQMIGDFRRKMIAEGRADLLAPIRVHTKCVPDLAVLDSISRADLQATIDRSRARLGLDALDLVQFHWWNTAVERYVEVAGWLTDFQKEGRITLLGTTNFNAACTQQLLDAGYPLATTQVQYSILDNRPAHKLVPLLQKAGAKLLCYGTVAGGFLSDKWLGVADPGEATRLENRSLTKYKLIIDDMGGWDLFQEILKTLRRIADRHGVNVADVAMGAMLDRPEVTAIIVGVRHGGHLEAHRRLFGLTLTDQDRRDLAAILAQRVELEGDVYDLERDRDGRHGRIMHYNLNG
ncbi:aldo/keto reductase [Pararhodobacter sp.]|uniref:aldo/keto reductase n=1 Tax=Pararhodobacter sp. TaxID=2127056 RepID=UPI002FE2F5B0